MDGGSRSQPWNDFISQETRNDRMLRRVLDRMPAALLTLEPVAVAEAAVADAPVEDVAAVEPVQVRCRWVVTAANAAAVELLGSEDGVLPGRPLDTILDATFLGHVSRELARLDGGSARGDGSASRGTPCAWRVFAIDGCRAGLLGLP